MAAWAWIVIIVAVIAVAALLVLRGIDATRRRNLRRTFGPEYDRAIERGDNRRSVEAELADRMKHRRTFELHPLDPGERDRFTEAWSGVQARFVDEPGTVVEEADALVVEVMGRRGYPAADFDERAADISVDHPDIVEDYRVAHGVAGSAAQGQASTEDLRQAMVRYRSLFTRLLDVEGAQRQEVRR